MSVKRIDILTIFPGMFKGFFEIGVVTLAKERSGIEVAAHDLRSFSDDPRQVDDAPYGGGPGMIMKAPPFFKGVKHLVGAYGDMSARRVVLLAPQGERLSQGKVEDLAGSEQIILLCGRYEGVDHRVASGLATDIISLGDFVLAGGEIAAMAIIESVLRISEGVLGCEDSADEESFANGLLEYPQYTRPPEFNGEKVPEVLISGDHGKIKEWRRRKSLEMTLDMRPDLLDEASLTENESTFLRESGWKEKKP